MDFLVLGAGGMAGHTIGLYLTERGHTVTGFDRKPVTYCRSVVGDAERPDTLDPIIADGHFDVVINCIGLLNWFAEARHASAVYLNSYLPHHLADLTRETPTRIIHMSTDCVFSGDRGSYTETDAPDGRSFYDRSKALGELDDDKNLTLRNSIIGPDTNPAGIGLLNWFMQQRGEIQGYRRAMWTGLTTLELAKAMEAAAAEGAHGLYNMVYDEPISKYDLLGLLNTHLRHDAITITPADTVVADKSLVRTRFDFSYRIPSYRVMVAELADWMHAHRTLYPHYDL